MPDETEKKDSIKRSKGEFHEFEKNPDNKDRYNAEVIKDTLIPQEAALKCNMYN